MKERDIDGDGERDREKQKGCKMIIEEATAII